MNSRNSDRLADSRTGGVARSTRVLSAITAMRANLDGPLNLQFLAKTAGMSRFHFIRVFNALAGATPSRFLAALRIERAKHLLLETPLSVTAISLEVGHSSVGTFTRTFTNFVGASPTAFRRLDRTLSALALEDCIERHLGSSCTPRRAHIRGSLSIPPTFTGTTFIGLFSSAIPQGRPLSGTLAFAAGRFEIESVRSNRCSSLLAVGLPSPLGVRSCLLPSQGEILVASATLTSPRPDPELTLRPLYPYDPPVLIALPLLLRP